MFTLTAKTTIANFFETRVALCRAVPRELTAHKAIFVRFADADYTTEFFAHEIAHGRTQNDGWMLTNSVFADTKALSLRITRIGGAMDGWETWADVIIDADAIIELKIEVETDDSYTPNDPSVVPSTSRKKYPVILTPDVDMIAWTEQVLATVDVPTGLLVRDGDVVNMDAAIRAAFDATRAAFRAAGAKEVFMLWHDDREAMSHFTVLIVGNTPTAFELGIDIGFGSGRVYFGHGGARRAA